jgi:uncharacterized protein
MTRSSDPSAFEVPTPVGEARVWLHPAPDGAHALLVLGHGAGRGVDTPDLQALAAALPGYGTAVALVDQPWVVAGRRVAGPPGQLDRAFLAVVPAVRERLPTRLPLVVGGRSAGARVACRTGATLGAVGLVALAFPLHPPGRPEKSRGEELTGAGVPALVVQGERDAFGGPVEVQRAVASAPVADGGPIQVVPVPYADHSLKVAAKAAVTAAEALQRVVAAVEDWLRDLID